jgi:predicted DNA-binding transcriptional regulator AlpA
MLEDAIRETATKAVSDLLRLDLKPGTQVLATSIREALLRIELVSAITGLSVPMIYREMSQAKFPRPLKITNSARACRLSEILAWIDDLPREGAS